MENIPIENNPTREFYEGLGKSNLTFHQALGELIDNSISAKRKTSIKIEINIQRIEEDRYVVAIVDDGFGIELEQLRTRVFKPGGRPNQQNRGRFNEHGFGLKNAISWFTGNNFPFKIVTSSSKSEIFHIVEGPFQQNMYIKSTNNQDDWLKFGTDDIEKIEISEISDKIGTRIYFETDKRRFITINPKNKGRLRTTIRRLHEHLGVIYRDLLKSDVQISVKWKDYTESNSTGSFQVSPVDPPWDSPRRTETLLREQASNNVGFTAEITWGKITPFKERSEEEFVKEPYPLKTYYQGFKTGIVVNVYLRGRLLTQVPAQKIWSSIRDLRFEWGKWNAEIQIDGWGLSTINNKTDIEVSSKYWDQIIEKIEELHKQFRNNPNKDPHPSSITKAPGQMEIEEDIIQSLRELGESEPKRIQSCWPNVGIPMDLYRDSENGKCTFWEIKTGKVQPQDVYQTMMYWDGLVLDGKIPTAGIIMGPEISPKAKTMIDDIKNGHGEFNFIDPRGNPYDIKYIRKETR